MTMCLVLFIDQEYVWLCWLYGLVAASIGCSSMTVSGVS